MASTSDEEIVVLELTDPSELEDEQFSLDEITISTSDIQSWNFDSILRSKIVKVQVNRSRLMEESSYFRGLLGGSFSESSLHHVSIRWNIEVVLNVLRFICTRSLNIRPNNFIHLLEAALFFGVDNLLLECETWLRHATSLRGFHVQELPLEIILEIWKFGSEHGITFLSELCEGYLAQHFVGVGGIM